MKQRIMEYTKVKSTIASSLKIFGKIAQNGHIFKLPLNYVSEFLTNLLWEYPFRMTGI